MPFATGSVQVVRIFGIRIGVSPSWFVVLFVLIYWLSSYFRNILGGSSTEGYLVAVAAALLFYVSLVMHELGHALAARRQGITVQRIDLWLLGGVAVLDSEPRSPGREFAVAAAGPAVTLVFVVVCGLAATLADSSSHFLDVARLQVTTSASPAYVLLSFLATMNLVIFAFNLIPAFPLDGGRIALAAAWKLTGDRAKAQRVAGRAGLGFAYVMGGVALFLLLRNDIANGIWFGVLAYFLAGSARASVARGTIDDRLQRVTVADVMDRDPLTVSGDTTLIDAHDRLFAPGGWPFVAVTDADGRFLGVLRRDVVDRELAAGRPALAARDALGDDAADWRVDVDDPLETVLAGDGLTRAGAVFAVDAQGVVKGVVTRDALRRVLTAAAAR
jgi:Zn-dependent protease/CBS domain-containing protein